MPDRTSLQRSLATVSEAWLSFALQPTRPAPLHWCCGSRLLPGGPHAPARLRPGYVPDRAFLWRPAGKGGGHWADPRGASAAYADRLSEKAPPFSITTKPRCSSRSSILAAVSCDTARKQEASSTSSVRSSSDIAWSSSSSSGFRSRGFRSGGLGGRGRGMGPVRYQCKGGGITCLGTAR